MEYNVYGVKIQKVRAAKGYTQEYMAEQLGMSSAKAYSRYETGETKLDLAHMEAIAKVFKMTLVELLSFDEKAFFNQCTGAMSVNGDNTYHEANQALVDELHERIKHQETEIAFLRKQLEAVLGRGKG